MKLSTRSRYALRMMLDVAKNADENTFVALKDVSERQEISLKYLEQIVMALTRAGLLTSTRGPKGGYALTRKAEEYTAGEIIRAIEGDLAPVACLECTPNRCTRSAFCETLKLWTGLQERIDDYLDGVTLATLMTQPEAPARNTQKTTDTNKKQPRRRKEHGNRESQSRVGI